MGAGRRLTVSEASRVLGLSRTTLLAAEEAGLLAAMRTPGGHRRYDPAELRRYAERAGAAPTWDEHGGDPPVAQPAPAETVTLAATARAALRPLAQALEADCAGLYLLHGDEPRFTAAFGVPRWLAERLSAADPPTPVAEALGTRRPCVFDPAGTRFPEPRSTGCGVALAVHRDGAPLGVLFVVSRRDLLASEVRVVEAFGDVLALLVADERRIVELERRLEAIGTLARPEPPAS